MKIETEQNTIVICTVMVTGLQGVSTFTQNALAYTVTIHICNPSDADIFITQDKWIKCHGYRRTEF